MQHVTKRWLKYPKLLGSLYSDCLEGHMGHPGGSSASLSSLASLGSFGHGEARDLREEPGLLHAQVALGDWAHLSARLGSGVRGGTGGHVVGRRSFFPPEKRQTQFGRANAQSWNRFLSGSLRTLEREKPSKIQELVFFPKSWLGQDMRMASVIRTYVLRC